MASLQNSTGTLTKNRRRRKHLSTSLGPVKKSLHRGGINVAPGTLGENNNEVK